MAIIGTLPLSDFMILEMSWEVSIDQGHPELVSPVTTLNSGRYLSPLTKDFFKVHLLFSDIGCFCRCQSDEREQTKAC